MAGIESIVVDEPPHNLSFQLLNILRDEVGKREIKEKIIYILDPILVYILNVFQPYITVVCSLILINIISQFYLIFLLRFRK